MITSKRVVVDHTSPLYYHDRLGAFECLGCGEMIEIPHCAVLTKGSRREPVRNSPENMLIWTELIEMDHAPCLAFSDAAMAAQAREHHNRVTQRSTGAHA